MRVQSHYLPVHLNKECYVKTNFKRFHPFIKTLYALVKDGICNQKTASLLYQNAELFIKTSDPIETTIEVSYGIG